MYTEAVATCYSMTQARTNLPAIIDQIEAGLEIVLTRRGKPVAVVVPVREKESARGCRPGFAEAYPRFLDKHSPDEVGIEGDFAASLRSHDTGRKVLL